MVVLAINVMVNRQYINKFEIYCELVLKRNSELVIDDLINDWNENNDVTNLVNLISNLHECLKVVCSLIF